jgi:DNA polymerase-3 subunit beta
MLASRKELSEALKVVLNVIPKNAFRPILDCCKIEFTGDGLVLSATDLDTAVRICVPTIGGANEKGVVAIDAQTLSNVISDKAAGDELEIRTENKHVFIGKAKMRASEDVDEFPEIPSLPTKGASRYALSEGFQDAVRFVVPAMARDATRYSLNGVFLDFRRGRVVATDGKRLHTAGIGEPENITPVIIAPKIIKAIQPDSVIIPAPEKIEGTKEKRITRIFLTFPNGVAVLRTIEGSFPDYAGLIPKKCPSRLETGRSDFLKSIRKIRQFTSVENDACKITANGSLIISAKNEEKGVEISEEVPGELTGKEQTIGINPGFVFDVLSGMKSERVNLYFQGAGGPMLVESVENGNSGFFALIMPVNIEN